MDADDLRLRNLTYGLFVELGRAPSADEVADREGTTADAVMAGWRRLHDGHAIVLDPTTDALRMANPFSGVPTAHVVEADGRRWYANCAWDAFGIPNLVGCDAVISTTCLDCSGKIVYRVENRRLVDSHGVVHFGVPAAKWWDDIGFT